MSVPYNDRNSLNAKGTCMVVDFLLFSMLISRRYIYIKTTYQIHQSSTFWYITKLDENSPMFIMEMI